MVKPVRLHHAANSLKRWCGVGDNGRHLGKMTRTDITNMLAVILAADNEYQVRVKDERVVALEAELAAAQTEIRRQRHRVTLHQRQAERVNERERKAADALEKAAEAIANAVGWQRASDGYVKQNAVLRAQLEAAKHRDRPEVPMNTDEPDGWDDGAEDRYVSEAEYRAYLQRRMPEIATEVTDALRAAGVLPEGIKVHGRKLGEPELSRLSDVLRTDPDCTTCDGTGWVCENDGKPWGGLCCDFHNTGPGISGVCEHGACGCGAGDPCPSCNPDPPLSSGFATIIASVEDQ